MELIALNLWLSYFFVSLRNAIGNNVLFILNFHLLLSIISYLGSYADQSEILTVLKKTTKCLLQHD
jgi:hypothetical protein